MDDSTGLETLLVGIDGACWPVVRPMVEGGALPVLGSLAAAGTAGPLTSCIPPWTPAAWPSVYTGVNPGKHGVFGFLRFEGYDPDIVDATTVRERTLWETLDGEGLRSVVVNAPVTAPPPAVDGAVLPGYVAPEDPPCHPDGLLDRVRTETGNYRLYPPDGLDTRDEHVEWYRRLTRMRGRAFRYLLDEFDPDFAFLQFQQSDTVIHELPGDESALRSVYETVDAELGTTLDSCDPDVVLVVSDHGTGAYEGYEFRINEFLREAGYVTTVADGGGMPSWSRLADERLRGDGSGGAGGGRGRTVLAAAGAALARVGLTARRLGRTARRLGVADLALRAAPGGLVRAGAERVDFVESRAYARSRVELGVRINLEGRDPDGVVSRDSYETVREDLIEELSAATTPGGDSVFETVAPREAFFDGPYVDEAVDVVTVPTGFDQFLSVGFPGAQFGAPSEPWNHKRDGLVIAAGPGVEGASLDDAHIYDVAPTVLATFGLPAATRMDGSALPVVGDAGECEYPEYRPRDRTDLADGRVERRLWNLGYLE